MICQVGVKTANLATIMNDKKSRIKQILRYHQTRHRRPREVVLRGPVRTDRIDALALCQRLDRYVRGNRKAFSVVWVPSEEEERERAISRQRGQLRERQEFAFG
jgi:hypothetical protein